MKDTLFYVSNDLWYGIFNFNKFVKISFKQLNRIFVQTVLNRISHFFSQHFNKWKVQSFMYHMICKIVFFKFDGFAKSSRWPILYFCSDSHNCISGFFSKSSNKWKVQSYMCCIFCKMVFWICKIQNDHHQNQNRNLIFLDKKPVEKMRFVN
jgi:hypothetical protein